tara:strand:+ start:544 stop:1482 length:939 start_codon:yes stop_codon:yes gene_type:complete
MNFKILREHRFKLLLILIVTVISLLLWGIYKFTSKLREESSVSPYYKGKNKNNYSNKFGTCDVGEDIQTEQECKDFHDYLAAGGITSFDVGYTLPIRPYNRLGAWSKRMAAGCNFTNFTNYGPGVYWNPGNTDGTSGNLAYISDAWRACNKLNPDTDPAYAPSGGSAPTTAPIAPLAPYESNPSNDIFIDNTVANPNVSKLMIIDKNTGKTSFVNKTLNEITNSLNIRNSQIFNALKLLLGNDLQGGGIPSEFLDSGNNGIIANMATGIKNKNESLAALGGETIDCSTSTATQDQPDSLTTDSQWTHDWNAG